MTKWQHRLTIYKITLLFMYFIFLVYALAFSIPAWFGPEKEKLDGYDKQVIGLWAWCFSPGRGDLNGCYKYAFGDYNAPWMDGVRAVWIAGMFFYVLAVLSSFVENCCTDAEKKDYGVSGVLALLAGLCGAVGVIVVAIKVEDLSSSWNYYWGYMLACIASGLTLILAIILLITRHVKLIEKPRDDRTADYILAHKPNPYTAGYTNHDNKYDIPVANGVRYQHTPSDNLYTTFKKGYNSKKLPQGSAYLKPSYNPHGYYGGAPDKKYIMAKSADLSNGFTNKLIKAARSLSRTKPVNQRDYIRGGDYSRQDFPGRHDYYNDSVVY